MQDFVNNKSTTSQMNAKPHGLMWRSLQILENSGTKKMNQFENSMSETSAIICNDGVFSIIQDLETSSVKQDPSLKALIDSVLR